MQPSRSRSGRQRVVVGAISSEPSVVETQRSPALAAIKECTTPVAGSWSDWAAGDPFLAITAKSTSGHLVQPSTTQVLDHVGFTTENNAAPQLPDTIDVEPGTADGSGWATFDSVDAGQGWFSVENNGSADICSSQFGWSVETTTKNEKSATNLELVVDPSVENRSENRPNPEHGNIGGILANESELKNLGFHESDFVDFQSSDFGFADDKTARFGAELDFDLRKSAGDVLISLGFGNSTTEEDLLKNPSFGDSDAVAACRFDASNETMLNKERIDIDISNSDLAVLPRSDIGASGLANVDFPVDCFLCNAPPSFGDRTILARAVEMVGGETDMNVYKTSKVSAEMAADGILGSIQADFDLHQELPFATVSDARLQGKHPVNDEGIEVVDNIITGDGIRNSAVMTSSGDDKHSTGTHQRIDASGSLPDLRSGAQLSRCALPFVHVGQSVVTFDSEPASQRSAEITSSPLIWETFGSVDCSPRSMQRCQIKEADCPAAPVASNESNIKDFTEIKSSKVEQSHLRGDENIDLPESCTSLDTLKADADRQVKYASSVCEVIADGAVDKDHISFNARKDAGGEVICPNKGLGITGAATESAASDEESASSSGGLSSTPSCSSSPTCSPAATPAPVRSDVAVSAPGEQPELGLGPVFSSSCTARPALSPPPTPSPPPKDAPRKIPGRPCASPKRLSGLSTSMSTKCKGIGAAQIELEDPLTRCIISGVAATRTRTSDSGATAFVTASFTPSPSFPRPAPLCPVFRVPAADVNWQPSLSQSPSSTGSKLAASGDASPCLSRNNSQSNASSRSLGDVDLNTGGNDESETGKAEEDVSIRPNLRVMDLTYSPAPIEAGGDCDIQEQDSKSRHISDPEGGLDGMDDEGRLVAFKTRVCEQPSTGSRCGAIKI